MTPTQNSNNYRRDDGRKAATMIESRTVLPATGFVRLPQIIGNPKANPPIPAIIPVSKSTWWAGVKSGRFPQAVKLGPRTTAWRVEDIRALIAA